MASYRRGKELFSLFVKHCTNNVRHNGGSERQSIAVYCKYFDSSNEREKEKEKENVK